MEHTRSDTEPGTPPGGRLAGAAAAVPGQRPNAPAMPARHSVRAQILAELRGALAAGELIPGQVYSARALAERYGVSATPVREAMQRLASEGAVAAVPNRGFRIAGLSNRDLAELAEVRAALEVPAVLGLVRRQRGGRAGPLASRGARWPTDHPDHPAAGRPGFAQTPGWDALRDLADVSVDAASRGDRPGYAEADLAFHRGLLDLTGNRQLAEVASDLLRRTQAPAEGRPVPAPATLRAAALQHVALLDALAEGEITLVERLLRDHLTRC
ncbi:GntR family transcriptional regulator [Streptomyces sp. SM12]|uniref:GntR family transcriptional regulator n=2 Tax=unclassified Streptomyces TaxID=2593676 RepID=UPI000CD4F88E|nr:GntR family transcriptional regulator [Streptomyces sp. SM12]